MIHKLAYTIEMSTKISDEKQQKAAGISQLFSEIINKIDLFSDHLKVIYNPFSKGDQVPPEQLYQKRFLFSRFKKKMEENYSVIKLHCLKAVNELNYFIQDTHIHEVINSFQDSMEQIDKLFKELSSHLDDVKANDFLPELIKKIDLIEAKLKLLKDFIDERIISHIEKNFLDADWFHKNNTDLELEIKKKDPLFQELFKERQSVLDGTKVPSTVQNSQILNPAQQHQSIYKATDVAQPKLEE